MTKKPGCDQDSKLGYHGHNVESGEVPLYDYGCKHCLSNVDELTFKFGIKWSNSRELFQARMKHWMSLANSYYIQPV